METLSDEEMPRTYSEMTHSAPRVRVEPRGLGPRRPPASPPRLPSRSHRAAYRCASPCAAGGRTRASGCARRMQVMVVVIIMLLTTMVVSSSARAPAQCVCGRLCARHELSRRRLHHVRVDVAHTRVLQPAAARLEHLANSAAVPISTPRLHAQFTPHLLQHLARFSHSRRRRPICAPQAPRERRDHRLGD